MTEINLIHKSHNCICGKPCTTKKLTVLKALLVNVLEGNIKSLKSNIHNFSQKTGQIGGAIDQDDYDVWVFELRGFQNILKEMEE